MEDVLLLGCSVLEGREMIELSVLLVGGYTHDCEVAHLDMDRVNLLEGAHRF